MSKTTARVQLLIARGRRICDAAVNRCAALVRLCATWIRPRFRNWPIKTKVWIGLALLLLAVVILASTGLYTTYSYRNLAKSLSRRVVELPVAAELNRYVGDARIALSKLRGLQSLELPKLHSGELSLAARMIRPEYANALYSIERKLDEYRDLLVDKQHEGWARDGRIAEIDKEKQTILEIERSLARVHELNADHDWLLDPTAVEDLDRELATLQDLTLELPSHLHYKLAGFAADVRTQYRTLIVGTWMGGVAAAVIVALFVASFYIWVFYPLRVIIAGSRQVAAGKFHYRIRLQGEDEMAELAEAMNDMTSRFQAIRDDLDRQVRERTKQVVRNEQLASVGFLAAGVAHEINNPLASIAMCAESLQRRVIRSSDDDAHRRPPDASSDALSGTASDTSSAEVAVASNYLEMIQSEAFRCKEITEKLLDFSRMGEMKRQDTDVAELVQSVIDMVSHLGKYQRKSIAFEAGPGMVASVNGQEIKQVVLNLITNALDCVPDDGGRVAALLRKQDHGLLLTVTDNGCGMTPDVLEHVFEPFFTRRRGGQGTGLGLSISYRIIADHEGTIEAESDGEGRGATFRVFLPRESQHQMKAA